MNRRDAEAQRAIIKIVVSRRLLWQPAPTIPSSIRVPVPHPQSQQVAPASWLGIILELGPAVQDESVVDELNISALHREAYRQLFPPVHALQNIDGLAIRRRQWRPCRLVALHEVEAEIPDRQRIAKS